MNRRQWSQAVATGPAQSARPVRLSGVHQGADATAALLAALTPESRALVLAGMPPAQRWVLMEALSDEERAGVIVAMAPPHRREAAAALAPDLWERTMDVMRSAGALAARCSRRSLLPRASLLQV